MSSTQSRSSRGTVSWAGSAIGSPSPASPSLPLDVQRVERQHRRCHRPFRSVVHTMSVCINMGMGNSDVEGLWDDLGQHNIEEKERGKEH